VDRGGGPHTGLEVKASRHSDGSVRLRIDSRCSVLPPTLGGRAQGWHLRLTEYRDSYLGHRVRRGGKMVTCLAIFRS
jgi:hypothetical protein